MRAKAITNIITFLITTCTGLTLAFAGGAEGERPFGAEIELRPVQVAIQIEVIEMSHSEMNELFFDKKVTAGRELRMELQKRIVAGKAKLAETALLLTDDGMRARSESITEIIYPTEYEPAASTEPAPGIEVKDGEKKKRATDPKPKPDAKPETGEDDAFPPSSSYPLPTAFDVRNVGTMIEAEPRILEDGKSIHLNISPEIVRYAGDEIYQEIATPDGKITTVKMPKFYSTRISTTITVKDGEYRLLSSLSPPDEHGAVDRQRKWLVFVRASIVK